MDIAGRSTSTDETGAPVKGTLQWYDEAGNRYHIWVLKDANGRWHIETATLRPFGTIYKRAEDDPQGHHVRRLDARTKAHQKTVGYVLEQQNAHGIIEENARDQAHRAALAKTEADAGHAEFMRGALRRFASELTGPDAPHAELFTMMANKLDDAQLNRLSAIVHDCAK